MCIHQQRQSFAERNNLVVSQKIVDLLTRLSRDKGFTEQTYLDVLSRHPDQERFIAEIAKHCPK
jgi:hypothetical protein